MGPIKVIVLGLSILTLAGCNSAKETPQTPPPPASAQSSPPATPSTPAAPKPAEEEHKWSCTKGKDSRELEVVKKADGCDLNYTKGGKLKVEMTAVHGEKKCEVREAKDLANLKKSGFKCT